MITKQQLGNYLWGMADILYGKVEDYKSYILTLLFYKRLSDNYAWDANNKVSEFEDKYGKQPNAKQLKQITKYAHQFIIPAGCFWNDVKQAPLIKKNELMQNACDEIANSNILPDGAFPLKGIINAVHWNEAAPDGSGRKRLDPSILQNLIIYLDPMNLSNDRVPLDILGHAYEYLIKRFADENKGGTVAGQFYTPPEIVELMVRTLKPQNGQRIYDPTCGSGGFLIKSANYVREKNSELKGLRLYGQETIWTTWAIATMNIMLHGLEGKILQGDTIRDPKFLKSENSIDTFDMVFANFPFSVENWAGNGTPKKDKKGKAVLNKDGSPQFSFPSKDSYSDKFGRFIYGVPDFSNGDFAFIQHIIASLEDEGRAAVVCPNGVLFKGQSEKTEEEDGQNRKADDLYLIRRGFIDGIGSEKKNIIDAIVALPENMFYGNTIPGCILFFNKNKPEHRKDKILMVWGAKKGWYKEEPDQNILRPQDVMRLLVQLESYGDKSEAERIIPVEEARLFQLVDDNLAFKELEINDNYKEELEEWIKTDALFRCMAELSETEQTLAFTSSNDITVKCKVKHGKFDFLPDEDGSLKLPLVEKSVLRLKIENGAVLELKVKADNKASISKADLYKVTKRLAKLTETLQKRDKSLADARLEAIREKEAIQKVSAELLVVFDHPELRKSYFSLVEIDEIIENEYNLNLPRYIDTVDPEEEIPVERAVSELEAALNNEKAIETKLNNYLKVLVNAD